ncbi:MAG: diadenylate cyclase CdaA [Lentisphaeria bacterium]|nr:diadenylate cyclase CdaA [Lentisphaeria bacterium]
MDYLTSFWLNYGSLGVELILIFLAVYGLLYLFRRTRAISVLWGVIVILLVLTQLAKVSGLEVFRWLLTNLWQLLSIALIVIFQEELRRAFAQLGSIMSFLTPSAHARQLEEEQAIKDIASAMMQMAFRRCGALIVIERRIGLAAIINNSVHLDAKINSLLLQSLFFPDSPLHDCAVIIRDWRIVAAHAILPLSKESRSFDFGTRHRAALGISEETDAIALVVSEETGKVSYAYKGNLVRNLDEEALVNFLKSELLGQKDLPQGEKSK